MLQFLINNHRHNPHRFYLFILQIGHTGIMIHLLYKAWLDNTMQFVVLLGYFVIHLIIYFFLVMAIEDIRQLYALVQELLKLDIEQNKIIKDLIERNNK
jgi:hypothetical protein